MALWDSLISAVSNFFSAPKTQTSWPTAPTPNYPSVNKSTPSYSSQISKSSYSAPKSTPTPTMKGVDVVTPSVGRSGGGVPSSSSAPSVSAPSQGKILPQAASTVAEAAAPVVGKLGKGLTTVGTALKAPQIVPGGLGAKAQGWAGFQQAVEEAKRGGFLGQLPEILSQYSKEAKGITPEQVWSLFGDITTKALNPFYAKPTVLQPNLSQVLPQGSPSAAVSKLPGQKMGAPIRTSQTGVRSIVPSSTPTPRQGMVPSAVNNQTLPANMQGLTQSNVNPQLAQAITPEAIQSIGQMLLRSMLGNQSSLTSITPGLAQALWGAPNSTSAFGGYEGGASVPDQQRISQPANLPPVPQPVAQG